MDFMNELARFFEAMKIFPNPNSRDVSDYLNGLQQSQKSDLRNEVEFASEAASNSSSERFESYLQILKTFLSE
jgi:hypothetical protein